MERLGYSSKRLLKEAQQLQQVYDMSDLDHDTACGVQSVLAYAGTAEVLQLTEEEIYIQEDEERACFPEPVMNVTEEVEKVR